MHKIIGQKARKLKGKARGKSGQARAQKAARRRKRNEKRRVRQLLPRRSLLGRLARPLEAALRMAVDPAKERSWFPQLTMLGFLLSGLIFHVLSLSSLRDVVATMGNLPELRLGPVRRSTLSDALNSKRRLKLVRQVFNNLVDISREHCPRRLARFKQIPALHSTLLHCVASAAWAKYRKGVNACKAHILLDLASGIPDKLVISEGRVHDRKCFSTFLRKGWTYIVDRAYNAYGLFDHMIEEGIFFVTRMKNNAVYELLKRHRVSRSQKRKGVLSDETIRLGNGPTVMRNNTRRIIFRDKEGKEYCFLTNRFDLAPATVASLDHARWAIGIFFKWLKRTLRGERFLSRSDVAAEIHVLIALLVRVLPKILARTIKPVPFPQILHHVPVEFLRIVRYFLLKTFQLSVLRRLEVSLE